MSGREPDPTVPAPSDEAAGATPRAKEAAARALCLMEGWREDDPRLVTDGLPAWIHHAEAALTAAYALDLPHREAQVRAATLRDVIEYLRDGYLIASESVAAHFNQEAS